MGVSPATRGTTDAATMYDSGKSARRCSSRRLPMPLPLPPASECSSMKEGQPSHSSASRRMPSMTLKGSSDCGVMGEWRSAMEGVAETRGHEADCSSGQGPKNRHMTTQQDLMVRDQKLQPYRGRA